MKRPVELVKMNCDIFYKMEFIFTHKNLQLIIFFKERSCQIKEIRIDYY